MPKFQIVTEDPLIKLPWTKVKTFKSKDQIVPYQGHSYQIIAKAERNYTCSERCTRAAIAIVAIFFTVSLALCVKAVRNLLTKKRSIVHYAKRIDLTGQRTDIISNQILASQSSELNNTVDRFQSKPKEKQEQLLESPTKTDVSNPNEGLQTKKENPKESEKVNNGLAKPQANASKLTQIKANDEVINPKIVKTTDDKAPVRTRPLIEEVTHHVPIPVINILDLGLHADPKLKQQEIYPNIFTIKIDPNSALMLPYSIIPFLKNPNYKEIPEESTFDSLNKYLKCSDELNLDDIVVDLYLDAIIIKNAIDLGLLNLDLDILTGKRKPTKAEDRILSYPQSKNQIKLLQERIALLNSLIDLAHRLSDQNNIKLKVKGRVG